jgi:hypothetical protein
MGQRKGQRAVQKDFHLHNLPRTTPPGNAISAAPATGLPLFLCQSWERARLGGHFTRPRGKLIYAENFQALCEWHAHKG